MPHRPIRVGWPHQRRAFLAYVEILVPTLKPGDVVVMDNFGSTRTGPSAKPYALPARGSCSAALQPRSEPYRTSLRQAQNPPQKSRGAHHRGCLEKDRITAQMLPSSRVRRLLQK